MCWEGDMQDPARVSRRGRAKYSTRFAHTDRLYLIDMLCWRGDPIKAQQLGACPYESSN